MNEGNNSLNGNVQLLAEAMRDVFPESMDAVYRKVKNDINGVKADIKDMKSDIDAWVEDMGQRLDTTDRICIRCWPPVKKKSAS